MNRFGMLTAGVAAGVCLAAAMTAATGCGKRSASVDEGKPGKMYLIVTLKGHPVLQIAQIAHKDACRRLGYESVVVGTDGPEQALGGQSIMAVRDVTELTVYIKAYRVAMDFFVEF